VAFDKLDHAALLGPVEPPADGNGFPVLGRKVGAGLPGRPARHRTPEPGPAAGQSACMARHIALLRINHGSCSRVSMPELRELL
jgi:hypothetical protein